MIQIANPTFATSTDTEDHLLTPATSMDSRSETPTTREASMEHEPEGKRKESTASNVKSNADAKGSFASILKKDRCAIKAALKTFIYDQWSMANMLAKEDRFQKFKDIMERKLLLRESNPRTDTARHKYPLLWNKQEQLVWLMKQHPEYLNSGPAPGNTRGQYLDQDDDEDMPGEMMHIKREIEVHSEENVRYARKQKSSIRAKQEAEDETDEEDKGPQKPVICQAISRGIPVKVDTITAKGDNGVAGSCRVEKVATNGSKGVKRRWKWIDMRMVAWPPVESDSDVDEITGSLLKRELEGVCETSSRKRARP